MQLRPSTSEISPDRARVPRAAWVRRPSASQAVLKGQMPHRDPLAGQPAKRLRRQKAAGGEFECHPPPGRQPRQGEFLVLSEIGRHDSTTYPIYNIEPDARWGKEPVWALRAPAGRVSIGGMQKFLKPTLVIVVLVVLAAGTAVLL